MKLSKKLAQQVASEMKEGFFDIFLDWLRKISAAEIWMNGFDLAKLAELAIKGKDIKSVNDSVSTQKEYERYQNRVKALKKKGWKIFADEQNYESVETIMYK